VNEGTPVRGGDRLLLRSSYCGHIALNTFIFDDWLTIAAQEGHTPVLSQFKLEGAFRKIYLKGLTLLKDSYQGDGRYWEAEDINHNSNACLYLASSSFWGKGSQVKALRSVSHCEIVNCRIENISFGLSIGTTDFRHPLAGALQGIGCFDGSSIAG
jgi:hypothetical protein